MSAPLLAVEDLQVAAPGGQAILHGISLRLERGETLGVVGESGSGKTMMALALMGLLPDGMTAQGRLLLDGAALPAPGSDDWDAIRGRRIGMVFQEPLTALNPAMTVGDQIAEGLVWHRDMPWDQARREAVRLMDRVRIEQAEERAGRYPHQLSGGQRQRACIAIALALRPALLIADEPTTALDVTVQREVLDLLAQFVAEERMALMIVSHNPGVLAYASGRIMVMRRGHVAETGATRDVLTRPAHPYTQALLAAMPRRRGKAGA